GFSVEAVAKRAGVGKASIYLRWRTKQALLLEALQQHVSGVTAIEPADVREELVQLARQLFGHYLGDAGRAAFRIALEADRIPGVAEHWASIRQSQILAARAIVRRAIERGELPAGTSVTLLLDTLSGAVMNHVQTTPPEARAKLATSAGSYARRLVDFLLANATAAASESRGGPENAS
ncbi:TetR/AcrR family transcriptional regulator, partial [Amycolatopsis acidiphila]